MTGKDTYDQAVSHLPAAPDRLTELAALVELGLGEPLPPDTFKCLAGIQAELWKSQDELAELLLNDGIGQSNYMTRLNISVRNAMDASERLLGRRRFRAIFGESGMNPVGLTDEEMFLANPPPGLQKK